jgi:hypothetical protein
MKDRRHHPRVPVRYLSTFSAAPKKAGEVLVVDLSLGGCRVESALLVRPGMDLGFQISLPNQVAPFTVDRAEVRWARQREFGVSFRSLRPEEQERLRRLVSSARSGSAPLH